MKRKFGVSAVLSALALLAITATVPASASVISLSSTINGAQANAGDGTGSPGTGSASMLFDDVTNVFSWNISWSDLSGPAVAAHFHGAATPNQNAGVQVPLTDLLSPSIESAIISNAQAADLLAGLWYINIHTAVNPAGEIRGQVLVVPDPTIPEPSTIALFGLGLAGLGFARRKKA